MVRPVVSPAPSHHQDATDLAGKSVIISGGTTGVGRATAELLAAEGARVFVFGRHEEDLHETIGTAGVADVGEPRGRRGEIHGTVADQSKQADVERVFREADEKLGGCDILINNAAVAGGSVFEQEIPDIRYVLEANLFGYLACTHEALQRMKRKGQGGHIVNVGSMSADLREPEGDIYVATKAAIQAFSESLRKTANKQGIRVSLIEPGAIATPIQEKSPEEKQRRLDEMEMLPPEDIAHCVLYVLRQPQRCDVVSIQIRPLKQLI
jgi:NAD(P)-dependent dehydrogenase (short-subunit alcohol dehydrogenase family)